MDGVTFFFLCLVFLALIAASVFLYHMKYEPIYLFIYFWLLPQLI